MGYKFEKYSIGGGGSGIIDVTELPTENIDEKSIYRVANEGNPQVIMFFGADGMQVFPNAEAGGEVYIVADKDTTDMKPSDPNVGQLYLYIDESENGIVYANADGALKTLSELFAGDTSLDKGWLLCDKSQLTEVGIYADRGITYAYYANKGGIWTELSNKGVGVEFFEVSVNTDDGTVNGVSDELYEKIVAYPFNLVVFDLVYELHYRSVGRGNNSEEILFSNMRVENGILAIRTITFNPYQKTATHTSNIAELRAE